MQSSMSCKDEKHWASSHHMTCQYLVRVCQPSCPSTCSNSPIKTHNALFHRLTLEYSSSHKTSVGLKQNQDSLCDSVMLIQIDWKGGGKWLSTFVASHHCNWRESQGDCRAWGWWDLWRPSGPSLTLRLLQTTTPKTSVYLIVPLLDKNTLS